jgi:hypothetical protein
MPISWEDRKRLLRLHGVADELLASARTPHDSNASAALEAQLDAISNEILAVLAQNDEDLADEFSRLVMAVGTDSPPSDVRAAVLVGWLKAGLAAETMEAQRPEPPRRKQTIGFKIRSPITRETEGREGAENSQRTTSRGS